MGISNIHAVIFDMDGLLLDTERIFLKAFSQTRISLDLALSDDLCLSLIGLDAKQTKAKLAAGLDGHIDPDTFNKEWDQRCTALFMEPIPVKFGVHDLVQHLRSSEIPMAVATSTNTKAARHHLAEAGLINFFATIICGDQVENGKPAPDIYLKAAAALDMEPQKCAAFEDSDTGTRAAVAAGLRTVQVPDLQDPSPETVALNHHIATDLISGAQHLGLMK